MDDEIKKNVANNWRTKNSNYLYEVENELREKIW